MTKDEVMEKIKKILSKDARFKSVTVTIKTTDKSKSNSRT